MSIIQKMVVLGLVGVILVVTTAFSTTAFTTSTLEREAQIDVVTDESALVSLVDGFPQGGLVEETGDGQLQIDFAAGGGDGANLDATFELGNRNNPIKRHAFRIVNRGTQARSFTVGYTLDGSDPDPSRTNVRFKLYHVAGSDGSIDGTVSVNEGPNNQVTIPSVGSGDKIYVVVIVDTNGLSSANDLSGTLDVEAGG